MLHCGPWSNVKMFRCRFNDTLWKSDACHRAYYNGMFREEKIRGLSPGFRACLFSGFSLLGSLLCSTRANLVSSELCLLSVVRSVACSCT